jgi:exonuclease III
MFQKMIDLDIDILTIQEVNTNLLQHRSEKIVQTATHHYQLIQQIWSHTPYKTTTSHKPGGVALFIKNPSAKYVVQRIIDKMGRWEGVAITLKEVKITILSIYQPPKQQIKGSINVTSQQIRLIHDQGLKKTVRQQFRSNLNELMYVLRDKKHEVIIGRDFNEHKIVDKFYMI